MIKNRIGNLGNLENLENLGSALSANFLKLLKLLKLPKLLKLSKNLPTSRSAYKTAVSLQVPYQTVPSRSSRLVSGWRPPKGRSQ